MRASSVLLTLFLSIATSCAVTEEPVTSDRSGSAPGACSSDRECGDNGACVIDRSGLGACYCSDGLVGTHCEWSSSEVLEEFTQIDPVDPRAWNDHEPSRLRYRHATAQEIARNGWKPGSFLVEAGSLFDDLAVRRQDIAVLVPLTLQTARMLELGWVAEERGPGFVEVGGTPKGLGKGKVAIEGTRPVFHRFASRLRVRDGEIDLLGALATATSVEGDTQVMIEGHLERKGAVGSSVDRVRVTPLNSYWQLDALPDAGMGVEDLLLVQWSPAATPMQELPSQPLDLCPPPILTQDLFDPNQPLDDDSPLHHPCVEPGDSPLPGSLTECENGLDDDGDEDWDVDGAPDFGVDPRPIDEMCEHSSECRPGLEHPECLEFENDCDPGLINPEHAHLESGLSYGQFGDVVWCTANEATWKVQMQSRNAKMLQAINAPAYGNPDYAEYVDRPGARTMVWRASKCWLLPDMEAARACRTSKANCGPFAKGTEHEYPYGGNANDKWAQHIARGAADLHHAVHLPEPFNTIDHPLDMWLVIVHEGSEDADHGGQYEAWGGSSAYDKRGAVINGAKAQSGDFEDGRDMAHELAHAFGCSHCDVDEVPKWGQYSEDNEAVVGEVPGVFGGSIMMTTDEEEKAEDGCADAYESNIHANRFAEACSRWIISDTFNAFNRRTDAWAPTFGKPIEEVHWW